MIGYNFRFGEIESAIAIEQLKKLPYFVAKRQKVGKKLTQGLKDLLNLKIPLIRNESTHVYYYFPITLDTKALDIPRNIILDALLAEGVQGLCNGYKNIYLLPMYQKKTAYGLNRFPWSLNNNEINYNKGICPVAENLYFQDFFAIQLCLFDLSDDDLKLIIDAFHKVWESLDTLASKC